MSIWFTCLRGTRVQSCSFVPHGSAPSVTAGWGQRVRKRRPKNPTKRCIWLHAVSMGEVNAAKTLVAEIEKQYPDYEIVVSTTTDTGYAQADKLFGRKWRVLLLSVRYLLDRSAGVRPPSTLSCLLMELEVWPNFPVHRPSIAGPRRRPQRSHQRPQLHAIPKRSSP